MLDELLSDEGWAYASTPPVEPGDPGRFHALFGRDSLITALQVLPERPDVARATLRALAALQGRRDDPETDEEPGKILHEYRPQAEPRFAELGWPVRDGQLLYYGSADSTSWFLVVLAALGDDALSAELEPARRAAAGWLERALERGGGLVRYGPRTSSGGLVQQGWRDAAAPVEAHPNGGGILRPDGSAPAAPQADADVQAVAYAALRALGDEERAAALAARIERDFGPDVMALEAGDVPVPGAGSQLGWLLWSGALGEERAGEVAARLCEPDVLTPFGLRTLSRTTRCSIPRATTAARSGRSTRGWGGAGCAPPASPRRPSACAPACWRRWTGSARRPSCTRSTRPASCSPRPPPTVCRRGRSGARWALEHGWDGRG